MSPHPFAPLYRAAAAQARGGVCLASLLALLAPGCITLGPFGSDAGKTESPGRGVERPAYPAVLSYFGTVQPGAEADEIREGKHMFYVYAWLPVPSREIGVRMASPVGSLAAPRPQDFVEQAYSNNSGSKVHFDPWVRLERCLQNTVPEEIAQPCQSWVTYGENDNSAEMPGETNALLRVPASNDDPLRALAAGLYRVAFTTQVAGEVQGTYVLQLASTEPLQGAALARSQPDLAQFVAQRARGQPAERPTSAR